jgi:hypothetical protein
MMVTNVGGSLGIYKNGQAATFSGLATNGDLLAYASTFNVTLAAEITVFDAKIKENQALLTWQTATEKDVSHFDIERRGSDSPFFETIGSVKAANAAHTYIFTDNTPLSTNYYRLRQIDKEGKAIVSKIIALSAQVSGKLKVYPSLVKDALTVDMATDSDFQIVNIFGQEVMRGQGTTRLDVAFLPRGAYILRMGNEHAKFIKQ